MKMHEDITTIYFLLHDPKNFTSNGTWYIHKMSYKYVAIILKV
jgi:hypothetical protein